MIYHGLNRFLNDIKKGAIKCILPGEDGILRIKNGFNDILTKWKSYNDAGYVDIKWLKIKMVYN